MRLPRSSWLCLLLVLAVACNTPGESPLPPPDEGRISGQVVLDDAASPAGITVTVTDTELTATTDTEGRFSLEGVSPGTHTLVVTKPRYREASEDVVVKARQAASATLTLKRERGGLTGTVQLEGGASAEGLTVALTDTELQTRTDAQGHFVFAELPTGPYTVRVLKETYAPAQETVEVAVDVQASVTLSLQRERGAVAGTLQLEGGASAGGIAVQLVGTDFSTVTDAEGRFTLTGVPTGTYMLHAQRDGYVQHEQSVEVRVGAQTSITQTLARERGSVAGTILLEGGASAGNLLVTLVDTDILSRGNAQGEFILVGVPTGTYTLRVQHEGHVTHEQQVEVRAGEQTSVSQTLARERGSVAGTVLLEGGVGAEGIAVRLVDTDFSTQTDDKGQFGLPGIPTGTYTLRVTNDRYRPFEQQVEVRANAQTSFSGMLIRARGAIAGRVQLEDGESAEGVYVAAYGSEESLGMLTDAEGRFNITGLPTGTYRVVARLDHHVTPEVSVEVRLDASETLAINMVRQGAPSLVVPKLAVQRGYLELTGSGFGEKRGESTVSLGGIEVPEYRFWSDTQVLVRVPANISPGVHDVVLKPGPDWRPAATVGLRVLRQQTLAASINDWNLGVTPENTVTGWGPSAPNGGQRPAMLSDVVSVATGEDFGLGLKADGSVIEWGTHHAPWTPMPDGLSNVVAIQAGGDVAAALLRDGTVVSWGSTQYNQTKVPPGLQDVVALSVSIYYSRALKADGTVVTWGNNVYGQVSVPPADLSGVKAIGGNSYGGVAILSDGSLRGWDSGATSDGYEYVTDPVAFIDVRGGHDVLVALRQDGTVRAWGRNDNGQANPPATLTGVADAMPMGISSGVALLQDGTVTWWGGPVNPSRLPPAGLVLRVAPR